MTLPPEAPSLLFYLSHALSESSPLVEAFFKDLSVSIHSRREFSQKSVGFLEQSLVEGESEWSGAAKEALRTSKTIVSLLSPNYFRSERGGKEWQIFELRSQQLPPTDSQAPRSTLTSLASVFVPIRWIASEGSLPEIIKRRIADHRGPGDLFKTRGIARLIEAGGDDEFKYRQFINRLAVAIIETARRFDLPNLGSLPAMSEVEDAFQGFAAETTKTFVLESQASEQKFFVIDSAFIKTLATKIDETPASEMWVNSEPATVNDPVAAPTPPAPDVRTGSRPTRPYKIWVVDYNSKARERICNTLRHYDSDPTAFDSAEGVRNEIADNPLPDLFLIDLELGPGRVQGLELIETIANLPTSTSMIAVSSNPDDLFAAMKVGAVAVLPKRFSMSSEIANLRRWAEVGRNRRKSLRGDPRVDRPVFLSYSNEDKKMAMGLLAQIEYRQIDVWYAERDQQPGHDWREYVDGKIWDALVFVALMTDNYKKSDYCIEEWHTFRAREKHGPNPSLLLPVFTGPVTSRHRPIDHVLGSLQCVDFSREEFLKKLNAMVRQIETKIRSASRARAAKAGV